MKWIKLYIRTQLKGLFSHWNNLKTMFPYLIGFSHQYRATTEEYPDKVSARMPEDLPVRFRGFLSNDIERCSGCGYCKNVCPTDCILIETEQGLEKNTSWISTFTIDHGKCIFCGLCVEYCPTKSLVHTREYEGTVSLPTQLIKEFGKGYLNTEVRAQWQSLQKEKNIELRQHEKDSVLKEIQKKMGKNGKPK